MGFSRLGASFNVTSISLSSSEAGNYFAGSQRFYPDQVEVFYYHCKLILCKKNRSLFSLVLFFINLKAALKLREKAILFRPNKIVKQSSMTAW